MTRAILHCNLLKFYDVTLSSTIFVRPLEIFFDFLLMFEDLSNFFNTNFCCWILVLWRMPWSCVCNWLHWWEENGWISPGFQLVHCIIMLSSIINCFNLKIYSVTLLQSQDNNIWDNSLDIKIKGEYKLFSCKTCMLSSSWNRLN